MAALLSHVVKCVLCQPERELPTGGDEARPSGRGVFWAEEDEMEVADGRADAVEFDRPVRLSVRPGRRGSRSRSPVRSKQAPDWHCNTHCSCLRIADLQQDSPQAHLACWSCVSL